MKIRPLFTMLFSLPVGFLLIWWSLSHMDFSWESFCSAWAAADKKWIFLALGAHLINHALRSYRWCLLLRTQGVSPRLYQAYLSEMTGFFWNGLGGKIGELMRCEVLKNMCKISRQKAFATVIIERVVDILFFLGLFVVILIAYFTSIKNIIIEVLGRLFNPLFEPENTLYWLILVIVIGFFFLFLFKFEGAKVIKKRIHTFFSECIQSIKIARNVNIKPFLLATISTWLFYFLLEFMSLFAFQNTHDAVVEHGIVPALCVFIGLNFSHLIPTPNGAGVYHILIPVILTHFGVSEKIAITYAIITHGIQMFNAWIPGGICYCISFLSPKNSLKKQGLLVMEGDNTER